AYDAFIRRFTSSLKFCLGGIFFDARQQRHFVEREHAVDIQDNDETLIDLDHASDEIGANFCAECRWRLNHVGADIHHFADAVDDDADILLLAIVIHFDNDDAGAALGLRLRAPEARRQIDHRHHLPTQIEHAANEVRHQWHAGQIAEF